MISSIQSGKDSQNSNVLSALFAKTSVNGNSTNAVGAIDMSKLSTNVLKEKIKAKMAGKL